MVDNKEKTPVHVRFRKSVATHLPRLEKMRARMTTWLDKSTDSDREKLQTVVDAIDEARLAHETLERAYEALGDWRPRKGRQPSESAKTVAASIDIGTHVSIADKHRETYEPLLGEEDMTGLEVLRMNGKLVHVALPSEDHLDPSQREGAYLPRAVLTAV